ncbi:hypothetical protein L288_14620 [Sphingobium quisquiliarum P25]|uniref:Uncharacterized protein n=1 Tax=Sphingobium quisquiliarum P25 TaxID=1329909 RepID=T0HX06_9SPHN|nr:hypothetical protein L288_14620 [Sphingobium quisquiliarum P25]
MFRLAKVEFREAVDGVIDRNFSASAPLTWNSSSQLQSPM